LEVGFPADYLSTSIELPKKAVTWIPAAQAGGATVLEMVFSFESEEEHATAVLKALRGIPEVQALHTTNGRWDIVVELGVDSLETFDQAPQRVRLIKGISNSETSLLLSTHKI
jgi:DNA-binding Lrp family transcriptional regulator